MLSPRNKPSVHRISLRQLQNLITASIDLQILCGAGISMISPTNLPSGNDLRDICVTELLSDQISKKFIVALLKSKTYQALLPEAVLQDLGSTLGSCLDETLVSLLGGAKTNVVHQHLAANYSSMFTTNFDLCLEVSSAKHIHHLHGTIAKPESLQNRMYRLGKTAASEMRSFRANIKNKPLLVLGYSLRDRDVVDAIAQNPPSTILYLSRSGAVPTTQLSLKSPIYVVSGSAEDLFDLHTRKPARRMRKNIRIRKPGKQRRANALERLCFRAAQYDLGVAVVRAYLPVLRGRSRVQALCGMANTLRVMGRFDESTKICCEVMKTTAARKPENADVLSTAHVVLGLCDLDQGNKNYAEIEKAFLKGLTIFEALVTKEKKSGHRVENDIWRARIFNNLGLLAQARGRHREAIRYYLRSCKLKQKHFEEYGLAQTTSNLAKTYIASGELLLASNCLRKVLTWMQKIPDSYICEDAIFEILQTLYSQRLVKIHSNAAAFASRYSAKWWHRQIKLANHDVRKILRTLYQLRIILSTLKS